MTELCESGRSPSALPTIAKLLVSGTPRARGRAHGEQLRASIQAAVDLVARRCGGGVRTDPVAGALAAMAGCLPALFAEFAGVAEGADVDPHALAVLNGATVSTASAQALPVADGGGTSIYCSGPDGPMLGHVLDLPPALADSAFVLEVVGVDNERRAAVVTTPGVLGLLGLGEHGLAVSSLGLHSGAAAGIPFAVLTRALLQCPSPAAALDRLRETPRVTGRYWVLTDGKDFVGAETSTSHVVRTQRGAKAAHLHTNHCFDPVLRREEAVPRDSTTFSRINAASTVYAQHRPRTPEALWTLLNAHDDGPLGTLCQHGTEDSGTKESGTRESGTGDSDSAVTAAIALVEPRTRVVHVVGGCSRRGTRRIVSVGASEANGSVIPQ